ncbi:hypothetical protein Tco_0714752 [Tanacetum coccineum]
MDGNTYGRRSNIIYAKEDSSYTEKSVAKLLWEEGEYANSDTISDSFVKSKASLKKWEVGEHLLRSNVASLNDYTPGNDEDLGSSSTIPTRTSFQRELEIIEKD